MTRALIPPFAIAITKQVQSIRLNYQYSLNFGIAPTEQNYLKIKMLRQIYLILVEQLI